MTTIDLNCDMGESYGRWTLGADAEIMPFVTSINVACGFRGGDPQVMRKTVTLARAHGVAVGAHPSLPDLVGFGRRAMDVSASELKDLICYQTGALREFLRAANGELQHVKPHGILYTMLEERPDLVMAAVESVRESGCHGDTPVAPAIVRAVRTALDRAGCHVMPLRDWLPA